MVSEPDRPAGACDSAAADGASALGAVVAAPDEQAAATRTAPARRPARRWFRFIGCLLLLSRVIDRFDHHVSLDDAGVAGVWAGGPERRSPSLADLSRWPRPPPCAPRVAQD